MTWRAISARPCEQGYDALSPKNSAPLPADESIVVTFEELDAGGSAVVSLVGLPIAINENELVRPGRGRSHCPSSSKVFVNPRFVS
jgi:hypothetical protein